MAIVKDFYKTRSDGVNLYKTYSNAGYMIKKVGTDEVYEEAIDVENAPYTYEETEEIEPIWVSKDDILPIINSEIMCSRAQIFLYMWYMKDLLI